MSSMTVPLYLSECSPPNIRGRITVIVTVFICSGEFVAGVVDGSFAQLEYGWRFMLGLGGVPSIILTV